MLEMEMAGVIDGGLYSVEATYYPEDGGGLVLTCSEQILKTQGAIQAGYYTNVQAIVRQTFPRGNALQQQ